MKLTTIALILFSGFAAAATTPLKPDYTGCTIPQIGFLDTAICPQQPGNSLTICFEVPNERCGGYPMPFNQLRGIRFFVDGIQIGSIAGQAVLAKRFTYKLQCYKPGRIVSAQAVDSTGLVSLVTPMFALPAKEGATCNKK